MLRIHTRPVALRAAGRLLFCGAASVVALAKPAVTAPAARQSDRLEISCGSISSRTTPADLRQKYGADNVVDASPVDDGIPGTVLYPSAPDRRIEISWADRARTRMAEFMAADRKSAWRTPQGIKAGQAIADVTDLNGRAFIFRGFNQPDGGFVVDWAGGTLAEADQGNCHVAVRLSPPVDVTFTTVEWRLAEVVSDAVEISSDDRRIKPYKAAVSALGLVWK